MAGRQIKELIVAYRDRDDLAFRRATQAIIEEEEAKRHTALARDLRLLLATSGHSVALEPQMLPQPPRDRDSNVPLADVAVSDSTGLGDLVFPPDVRDRLSSIVTEVAHWPELDAAGVPRRNRILLFGPPGCGKTSIASAMAGELAWPLVTTRVDSLISSYLGETAANLRSLFDYATSAPAVVLLDEFDSLGKLRDDPTDHGELRRVVNAVLQMVDTYRGPSLIVAATNNPEVLDTAIWRRFDEVIEVPLPGIEEITALLRRLLHQHIEVSAIGFVAQRLLGLPYAAVEHAVNGARRRAVLARRRSPATEDLSAATEDALARPWM